METYFGPSGKDWTPALKDWFTHRVSLDAYDFWVFKSTKEEQLTLPVSGKLLRGFGRKASPVDEREIFSPGIEIEALPGTPVKVALDGKINKVNFSAPFSAVEITHREELSTLYQGLGEIFVAPGQAVKQGETLGTVGEMGYLHFEVRKKGTPLDPLGYFSPFPLEGGKL